ncbi:hypothetical protein EP47_06355 [Legionella norrlandica]|uniref:Swiss Army Knife 2H phosphoesterase domain-containing protein n=1 Tax=Legionella norrlandica TaxID=1498499 RepID=A0A0A2SNU4_9GAMM|nr:hypothetical protein [Legionella norrlandica]KGP62387.1 hypothetical protein EP47_06355 [Legionella norrlandica]
MGEIFEQFIVTELSCKTALQKARNLRAEGILQQRDNYCYLKIDDDYIHFIHPILSVYDAIDKPDYFKPPDDVGAHISIIYPEENISLNRKHIGQRHRFSIDGLIKARFGLKEYFALSITSPSLVAFRQKYCLDPKPTFKGQQIVFHITVGVRANTRDIITE